MGTGQHNKQSKSMTHVAWESKLHSVVKLFLHPCPGNRLTIGRAVVFYGRAAQAFSAGIKCRHCASTFWVVQNVKSERQKSPGGGGGGTWVFRGVHTFVIKIKKYP